MGTVTLVGTVHREVGDVVLEPEKCEWHIQRDLRRTRKMKGPVVIDKCRSLRDLHEQRVLIEPAGTQPGVIRAVLGGTIHGRSRKREVEDQASIIRHPHCPPFMSIAR